MLCISANCGFAHNKKVFDRLGEGDYYIIEPGGRGVGSSQLRALLEPSLPRATAEYSSDNQEVLENANSMEGWLSLFRFLIDTKTQGATRTNPGLKGFATRACAAAFTTPLWDNTRRPQDDEDDRSDASGVETGPMPFGLQDAIMGVQGELGVWSASAPYCTIHGGLKILSKELVALDEVVVAQFAVHQGMLDTIRANSSTAVAVSKGLNCKWEQHQGTGGGEDTR